jgi:hypothetical protein
MLPSPTSDRPNTQVEQRIAAASFEQVDAWSARVLSAATLSELFAD